MIEGRKRKVRVVRTKRDGLMLKWKDLGGAQRQRRATGKTAEEAKREACILEKALAGESKHNTRRGKQYRRMLMEYERRLAELAFQIGEQYVKLRELQSSTSAHDYQFAAVPKDQVDWKDTQKLNRKVAAVYCIWDNDTVVYVGKTDDLKRRLRDHPHARSKDRFSWVELPYHEAHLTELHFIAKLRPARNSEVRKLFEGNGGFSCGADPMVQNSGIGLVSVCVSESAGT